MTFLSYAQNFEDVMLWRALRGIDRGFYIDVGAAHPDTDSVTRAFYDRGWSGINVEPVAASARRLTHARLRDITLQLALGDAAGATDFFVVEETGLSTLEPGALDAIGAAGFGVRTQQVEVSTLAAICRAHARGPIHFLKIDVEGGECAVLRGADFARFRPWIVVVEATAPMSRRETHGEWEPILLAAAYRFVYFDGLNRFYVAAERHAALAGAFATPPNVFDDFIRVGDVESVRRLADAQAQAAAFMARAREADRDAAAAAARGAESVQLQQALIALQAEHAAAAAAARDAAAWLAAMQASTSWRITAPLRAAVALAHAARRRLAAAPRPLPAPAPAAIPPQPAAAPPRPAPPPLAPPPLTPPPFAPPPFAPQAAGPAALRRVVHQFHSGSAVGDAITNAMLLTRDLLRRQGYLSEIFVEHVDPLLADELRPLAELPRHDGYVLIVRHSMGFDGFAEIAALPAPKVLIYHNITPPELLAEAPVLQDYARLGRTQLPQWRTLVQAALADSEYNAIELWRLGFDGAQACTLLFDLAALRSRAASVAPAAAEIRRPGMLTILFVGRVTPSKGQADLVAAYGAFRRGFAGPSRLVLVGRHDSAGSAYHDAIMARIAAADLAAHVTLTGLVPDAELHGWYAAADIYVSLSRHEGFGVPLIEAMAHGVPILAWPGGAIPYTLGDAGEILPGTAPQEVAAAMQALAADPGRRAAMAAQGRRALDRFALDHQLPLLWQALAQAGAARPDDPAARAMLDANMRFTVTGHVNKSYSLAAINRTLALAIEDIRPGSVRLAPVEGQPTDDLSEVPAAMRDAIAVLAARPPPQTGPELVISQHYPVYVPPARGDICTALFFWEESRIPAATIALLDRGFDGVLAPSRAVAKALIDSGLSIPVRLIGFAPDLAAFHRLPPRPAGAGGIFSFLHVSSGFPRKGVDVLLAAFAAVFTAADLVRLVIKVFPNPHNDVAAQIEQLRARTQDLAEIVLIDRDLPAEEMARLYGAADAMVLPSRGEGFNIPAAEAMAAGVPLIVTGFGGHMDFCTAENARLIDYRFAPSATHLATPHSVWAEPDAADLAAALREAVADRPAAAARVAAARRCVAALQDRGSLLWRLTQAGLSLLLAPPMPPLRIGWVSTWQVRCGIAGYSQNLLEAMPAVMGAIPAVTLFCDERTDPDAAGPQNATVQRAWRLGDQASLPGLATAIAAADPNVLVIQHQPGLLGWTGLAALLGMRALAERPVCVVLHTTRHLRDIAPEEQAAALAALAGVARVIVHTLADLNLLKGLGLVGNVTMLPHGAPAPIAGPPIRRLGLDDEVRIGCYGFFLPGKGIGELIAAAAILRRQGRKLRLCLVNADYGTPDSAREIAACRALAEEQGVPVAWHTDFLPGAESLALLGACDIVALPYQASREASSAALRTALSAGGVVAVTPLSLFDEAAGAVFRLPGSDPAGIAAGLAELIDDTALRARTREAAARWLAERAWPDIAARLQGMLRGLVRAA
jgi:FkbM family methyltransferase